MRAAKAAGYYSAGTVEFLVDGDGRFYFMEMNTRIQVEHPVTEMVTGIDLIKQMIRIAAGETLAYAQEDVTVRGHAIECRISAEGSRARISAVRGDSHGALSAGRQRACASIPFLFNGCSIPPFYDSMLAKIIVHADTRKEAICKMRSALGELIIEGITTNADFLYDLVGSEWFAEGDSQSDQCRTGRKVQSMLERPV